MANWLDKALGKKETSMVQSVPFERICLCNRRLSGRRQKRAKRVICDECGIAHFILPVNPYPESERTYFQSPDQKPTPAPRSKTKRRNPSPKTELDLKTELDPPTKASNPPADLSSSETEPELDLVEAAWSTSSDQSLTRFDDEVDDDDEYELADSDAEISLNSTSIRPQKKNTPAKPIESTEDIVARRAASRSTRLTIPSVKNERRSQRGRIVAVGGLILAVIAAMIAWTNHGRNLERAEITMREGHDIGEAALQNRDFALAREKLKEAVDAMELLGIDSEQRLQTRQLWLQAEAGFGLLDSTDVVEIAMAAVETVPENKESDDSDWQRRFRAQYFDRWLSIQLDPAEIIDGDEAFGQRVVFPAEPRIHLAGIDAAVAQQHGTRLWFAGPVKSCQRDPLNDSVWLIEFDSTRVIACDGTESLVRPMLTENELTEVMTARAAELAAQPESENGN